MIDLEFDIKKQGESEHFNRVEILRKGLPCGFASVNKDVDLSEAKQIVFK